MLPVAHRMRLSCEFDAAVRRGRRAGRRTLVVHATVQAGQDRSPLPRVGFVVSRAVGPAVVRNRVKRRLRAIVRERLPMLPPGALVVVRANPAAAAAVSGDLSADLDSALRRVLTPRRGTGEAGV